MASRTSTSSVRPSPAPNCPSWPSARTDSATRCGSGRAFRSTWPGTSRCARRCSARRPAPMSCCWSRTTSPATAGPSARSPGTWPTPTGPDARAVPPTGPACPSSTPTTPCGSASCWAIRTTRTVSTPVNWPTGARNSKGCRNGCGCPGSDRRVLGTPVAGVGAARWGVARAEPSPSCAAPNSTAPYWSWPANSTAPCSW